MSPHRQQDYWNRHIEAWTASTYGRPGSLPFLQRLATPFRGHLRARRDHAIDFIERVAPRSILELGCGTGELLAALPPSFRLERFVGVDVSGVAIEQARSRSYAAGVDHGPLFLAASLEELDLDPHRDPDLVLALGLTPYLEECELEKLLDLLHGRAFLIDFHPKGASIDNLLHWVYRRLARFPFYRTFGDQEIAALLRGAGLTGFEVVKRGRLSLIEQPGRR